MTSADKDLATRALFLLGECSLSDWSASTPIKRAVELFLERDKKELLGEIRWSFATKRERPNKIGLYSYDLPDDCLRLLDVLTAPTQKVLSFRIEGRIILCNEVIGELVYIENMPIREIMDMGFLETLEAKLASSIAMTVTGSSQKMKEMQALYERRLAKASHNNKIQDSSNDQHPLKTILNQSLFKRGQF